MTAEMIRCVHLKTGVDGRSHVEYNTIPLGIVQHATAVHFEETPAGSALDWHTAPHVQYVITLSGTLGRQTPHLVTTKVLRIASVEVWAVQRVIKT
jgi:hypothetical protein